jgi:hypothetical protein
MAELEQVKPVSLEDLVVTSLAITDVLAKLLVEKGVIIDAEFKEKLLQEHAVYQRILNPHHAMNGFRLSQSLPFVQLDCHRAFR